MPSLRACIIALPLLAAAGGCTAIAPGPTASLPPDAVAGAGDDTRAAIFSTATAFATPGALANRPAEAARALAQLEYLAIEIPSGPRWIGVNPTVGLELAAARDDARAALGVAPGTPPQVVIDQLYGVSRALRAGDEAAAERILTPAVFREGGAATLRRLAALPPLPRANHASALAQAELYRLDRQDGQGGPGGNNGGGSGGRS